MKESDVKWIKKRLIANNTNSRIHFTLLGGMILIMMNSIVSLHRGFSVWMEAGVNLIILGFILAILMYDRNRNHLHYGKLWEELREENKKGCVVGDET